MSKLTNLVKGRGSNIAGNKRMHHDLSVYEHEDLLRTNKEHVRCEKTCKEDSFDDERIDPTFTPSCKRRKCTETSIKTQPRRVGSLRGCNPSASKKSNTLLAPSSSLYDDYNPFRQDFPCWPSRKRTHVDRPKAKNYGGKDASITINRTTVRCPLAFLPKDHFNPKKRKVNTYLFVLTSLALSLENERCSKKKKVDSLVEETNLNNDEASLFSEAEWSAVEALYSMKTATPVPDERIAVEAPFAMEAMEEVSAPAIVPAKIPEPFTPAQRKIEASELQSTGTGLDFANASSSKIIDTSSLQKEESKCETAYEIIPIVVDSSESKPSKPKVYEVYRRKYKVASQEPQPFKPDISKVVASQEPQPWKPDIFKVVASKKPQRSKLDVFKVYSSRSKVLRLERLYRRFNIGLLSNLS